MLKGDEYALDLDVIKVHQDKERNAASEIQFWDDVFAFVPGEELLNGVAHLFWCEL